MTLETYLKSQDFATLIKEHPYFKKDADDLDSRFGFISECRQGPTENKGAVVSDGKQNNITTVITPTIYEQQTEASEETTSVQSEELQQPLRKIGFLTKHRITRASSPEVDCKKMAIKYRYLPKINTLLTINHRTP